AERLQNLPPLRDIAEDVLQVARPSQGRRGRRSLRSAPKAAPVTSCHARRGREEGSVPSAELSLWPGEDRGLPEAVPRDLRCRLDGASSAPETRHGAFAGEPEISAAYQALEALREGPTGSPAADGREVPRAHPGHTEAALPVHRHRRLHAHPGPE